MMANVERILADMRSNPRGIHFNDLKKICTAYFGDPRQNSTSHCVFKAPWPGDPRVNIQNKKGMAKAYQVKLVLLAIDKLETQHGA